MKKIIFINLLIISMGFSQHSDRLFKDINDYDRTDAQSQFEVSMFKFPFHGEIYYHLLSDGFYKVAVISDLNWHRIIIGRIKFDLSGNYIPNSDQTWSIGAYGSGNNQFKFPKGIAVTYGGVNNIDIYVADSGNDRVALLNVNLISGNNSCQIINPSLILDKPLDVEVDHKNNLDNSDDELWMVSSGNHLIICASKSTFFFSPIAHYGGNNELSFPTSLALRRVRASTSSSQMWISDNGNNRVICLENNFDGSLTQKDQYQYPSETDITDIQCDQTGYSFYTVDNLNHKIYKFNRIDHYIQKVGEYGNQGIGEKDLYYPLSIHIPFTLHINGSIFGWGQGGIIEIYSDNTGIKYFGAEGVDILDLRAVANQTGTLMSYSYKIPSGHGWIEEKIKSGGDVVRTLVGPNNWIVYATSTGSWDRRDDQGYLLPAGNYTLEVTIQSDYATDTKIETKNFMMNDITNIANNMNLSGEFNLTQDMTITNNAVVSIDNGTIFNLGEDVSIIVESGSKIIADGGPDAPIIFQRNDNNKKWSEILLEGDNNDFSDCIFDGGTYNVDVRSGGNDFNNCTFKNADRGINFSGVTTGSVSNSVFENNGYGIYLNESNPILDNNEISNSSNCGIYMVSSSPVLTNNFIFNNNGIGVNAVLSSPQFGTGIAASNGYNKIIDNSGVGIQSYSSSINMGSCVECHTNGGKNSVYNNTANCNKCHGGDSKEIHIFASSESQIDAENNWWGANPPEESSFIELDESRIVYEPWLESDPNEKIERISTTLSSTPSFESGEIFDHSQLNTLDYGEYKQYIKDYEGAIKEYEKVISKNLKLMDSRSALHKIKEIHSIVQNNDFKKYLDIITNKYPKSELSKTAELLKSDLYVEQAKYDQAIDINNKILNAYPDEYNLKRNALVKNLLIYLNKKKDKASANRVLNELEQLYESGNLCKGDKLIKHLNEMLDNFSNSKFDLKENLSIEIPKEFKLHNNYPNPFNPVTTIPISLPEQSHVKIVVYNILGQRLTTITDNIFETGRHEFRFGGHNLATGIYIIRAIVESKTNKNNRYDFKQKMLLIK